MNLRDMQEAWDRQIILEKINDLKNRIQGIIDGNQFVLFVKNKDSDDIYAGNEPARITFAQMLSPDDSLPDGWDDQANFSCINLSKILAGDGLSQNIFAKKDLKDLQILDDQDELLNLLSKVAKKSPEKVIVIPAENE